MYSLTKKDDLIFQQLSIIIISHIKILFVHITLNNPGAKVEMILGQLLECGNRAFKEDGLLGTSTSENVMDINNDRITDDRVCR